MGENLDTSEGIGTEKGAFSVSSSRVPDPPKPNLGSIGAAKLTAKSITSNYRGNKDGDTKNKDMGGFTISSSRTPDLPKPDIGSVGTAKIVAHDIEARQRKNGMSLKRSESEKRAKSATVVPTDEGRLSRSKSARIRSKAVPTPPSTSRLNSVSEDSDNISRQTKSSEQIKNDSNVVLNKTMSKEIEKPEAKEKKSSIVQDMLKSKVRTASTSSNEGKDITGPNSLQTSDDGASKDSETKSKKVVLQSKPAPVTSKDGVKSKSESGLTMAGVIAAKAIAKNARPSTAPGGKQRTANPMAALTLARRKPIRPKMDLPKALSMMGFGTARTLDPSGSKNARNELNAALTRKMTDFEAKRRKLLEQDKQKTFVAESVRNQTKDKLRDDIRTLHEAYQFLARKYMRDEEKLKEKMNNTTESDIQDMLDDLHLVNNFNDIEEKEEDNDVFSLKKSSNIVTSDMFKIKADRKKTM